MIWFVGCVDLQGGPVSEHELTRAIEKVDEHSPLSSFKIRKKTEGRIGFATVATEHHKRSIEIIECKALIIAGDIRIDNRKQLSKYLKGNLDIDNFTDQELFIRLYRQQGKEIVKEIVGEFSFFLWDKENEESFAARDQMGIKSLFWIKDNDQLWIASDMLLLQNLFSQTELNEQYFFQFYLQNGLVDSTITPYHQLNRVPSGHFLSTKNGRVSLHRYWHLSEVTGTVQYHSPHEYEEHFRQLLMESVNCRLSTDHSSAVMMSGGLDSTSVFALAKQLMKTDNRKQVFAVCGVFDELKECDERQYIKPLLKMYETEAYYEICDHHGVYKGFPFDSPWTFEPHVPSCTYGLTYSLVKHARDKGAESVLTGCAGDHFLSGTPGTLADSVKKFKFYSAYKNSKSLARITRGSMPKIMWHYGIAPHFKQGFYKEITMNRDQEFISQLALFPTFQQKEFYRQWNGTRSRLFMDREIGIQTGVDILHPMLDRRLVEFLYQLPSEQLWSEGTRKVILRNALKNDLPVEIVERRNKTVHLPLTYRGVREVWPDIYPILSEGRVQRFGWIDKVAWMKELHSWRQGLENREDFILMCTLEVWLYRWEERQKKQKKPVLL